MRKKDLLTRFGVAILLLPFISACEKVVEVAAQQVQSALRVDEGQLAELLSLAASQGLGLGTSLTTYTNRGTGSTGPIPRPSPAPSFRSLAEEICPRRTPPSVDLFSGNKTLIEDYSSCGDRSGQIKYESFLNEEGGFKIIVTFTNYTEGASSSTGYTYRNGESILSLLPIPGGLLLFLKNQINLRFNKGLPDGTTRPVNLQANDLWLYILDFTQRELVVNATSTLKDLDTFLSFILDLEEVTFHDPSDPNSSCPTNPIRGKASLSSERESLLVEITGCAQGKITDKDGRSKDIGQKGIEEIFGKAGENFLKLFQVILEGGIEEKVNRTTEIPCTVDPGEVSSIDPQLPQEIKNLLGVFCTAYPNYDGTQFLWGQAGWLDCHKICLVSPGRLASIDFFGVASTVKGPDTSLDYLFSPDPSQNWVMTSYAPLCREPVPYGFTALLPITSTAGSVQFLSLYAATPEELLTITPTDSIPPTVLEVEFRNTPDSALFWQGSLDASGNPDPYSFFLLGSYWRDSSNFMSLRECTAEDYPLVSGGVSGSEPQP